MTTATTETVVTATATVKEIPVRAYKPSKVEHTLTETQQTIATSVLDNIEETKKGWKLSEKAYYAAAEEQGLTKQQVKAVEEFNEDYVNAVHTVFTNKAFERFALKDNDGSDIEVSAKVGKNTTYTDTYRKSYTRQVSKGPGAGFEESTDYGYHQPSVATKYKALNEVRKNYYTQAEKLFGKK